MISSSKVVLLIYSNKLGDKTSNTLKADDIIFKSRVVDLQQ